VQAALADVNIVLGRARRAQIEYIDSEGMPDLLRDYESTVGQIPGTVRHVWELTADNPTQRSEIRNLLVARNFATQGTVPYLQGNL
jgi:hypothetical protein